MTAAVASFYAGAAIARVLKKHNNDAMRGACLAFGFCVLLSSCGRSARPAAVSAEGPALPAAAVAVLQAGEYPLWFQLGGQGPVLLDAIEDACFSSAFVPWPLAPHIRFILAGEDEVLMTVNSDGFLMFAPWDEFSGRRLSGDARRIEGRPAQTGLFRFSGGDFWKPYTLAAFVFFDDKPVALLYRDDRFIDPGAPLPDPRAWTFRRESPEPYALEVPAFSRFLPREGWDLDALRFSADGFWYYRVIRKNGTRNDVLFFRSPALAGEGEAVSLGSFQNAALPEPLSAAPDRLRSVLAGMGDAGIVSALSPGFQGPRYFAHNGDGPVNVMAYFRGGENAEVLAIDPAGRGLYLAPGTETAALSLPELPEGFVYTGIALCGQTIIAAWEEQEHFNIGAAGFMALRLPGMGK